jgi:hypothetical protein
MIQEFHIFHLFRNACGCTQLFAARYTRDFLATI